MATSNLRVVERKVLGALLLLCDENMTAQATKQKLAHAMGYKKPGGTITFALLALEMKNYIHIKGGTEYEVLI